MATLSKETTSTIKASLQKGPSIRRWRRAVRRANLMSSARPAWRLGCMRAVTETIQKFYLSLTCIRPLIKARLITIDKGAKNRWASGIWCPWRQSMTTQSGMNAARSVRTRTRETRKSWMAMEVFMVLSTIEIGSEDIQIYVTLKRALRTSFIRASDLVCIDLATVRAASS